MLVLVPTVVTVNSGGSPSPDAIRIVVERLDQVVRRDDERGMRVSDVFVRDGSQALFARSDFMHAALVGIYTDDKVKLARALDRDVSHRSALERTPGQASRQSEGREISRSESTGHTMALGST